jgi:hypothetical protein
VTENKQNAASLLAGALVIGVVCSFVYYGLAKPWAARIGWPWYAVWLLAILMPPYAYLAVKRGSARAALGIYMLFLTPGLLLGLVFPYALL